jgi:predicted RNA-binding protein Jag
MPIDDKIAAARKIEAFLKTIIQNGDFRLRYRITIDPPVTDSRDWERPSILVDLSGSDSRLLLAHNGELLRAVELLAIESLDLKHDEHEKLIFDCKNNRSMRLE